MRAARATPIRVRAMTSDDQAFWDRVFLHTYERLLDVTIAARDADEASVQRRCSAARLPKTTPPSVVWASKEDTIRFVESMIGMELLPAQRAAIRGLEGASKAGEESDIPPPLEQSQGA